MECNICGIEMEEDDICYCVVCGATICTGCANEDLDVCKECIE